MLFRVRPLKRLRTYYGAHDLDGFHHRGPLRQDQPVCMAITSTRAIYGTSAAGFGDLPGRLFYANLCTLADRFSSFIRSDRRSS